MPLAICVTLERIFVSIVGCACLEWRRLRLNTKSEAAATGFPCLRFTGVSPSFREDTCWLRRRFESLVKAQGEVWALARSISVRPELQGLALSLLVLQLRDESRHHPVFFFIALRHLAQGFSP